MSDFQAPANLESAGVIQNNPVDDYYWSLLDPASYRYINTTGPTQVRLRFQTDDNDDLSADYLKFYSGDYDGRQVFRPRLDIQYYLP